MSLDLDDRQRAMLQEMGLRVWAPVLPAQPVQSPAPPTVLPPALPPGLGQPVPAPARPTAVPPATPTAVPSAVPLLPVALSPLAEALGAPEAAALAQSIAACQACRLCKGRRAPVFDAPGAAQRADWLVVGDPPEEADEQGGTPFAGQSGLLLDNMLRALGLLRQQRAEPAADPATRAYLSHVVKCRSDSGGPPEAAELAACQTFLQREIAQVRPRIILAQGRFAALALLQGSMPQVASIPLGQLRGRIHQFQGLPVVVSYAPGYLLRNQADKARAWADLCLARQALLTMPI